MWVLTDLTPFWWIKEILMQVKIYIYDKICVSLWDRELFDKWLSFTARLYQLNFILFEWFEVSFFFISKTRNLTIANIPFSVLFLCLSFALLLLGLNFNSWLKIVDILSILKYSIFRNVEIFNIYISLIKNLACHSQRSFFPEIWAFFYRIDFFDKNTRLWFLFYQQ